MLIFDRIETVGVDVDFVLRSVIERAVSVHSQISYGDRWTEQVERYQDVIAAAYALRDALDNLHEDSLVMSGADKAGNRDAQVR